MATEVFQVDKIDPGMAHSLENVLGQIKGVCRIFCVKIWIIFSIFYSSPISYNGLWVFG